MGCGLPIYFSNRVSDRAVVMRPLRNGANLSSWASPSSYVGPRLTWAERSRLIGFQMGRTIWIAYAHRDDGKRFVVRADEKLTAFLELESPIQADS